MCNVLCAQTNPLAAHRNCKISVSYNAHAICYKTTNNKSISMQRSEKKTYCINFGSHSTKLNYNRICHKNKNQECPQFEEKSNPNTTSIRFKNITPMQHIRTREAPGERKKMVIIWRARALNSEITPARDTFCGCSFSSSSKKNRKKEK